MVELNINEMPSNWVERIASVRIHFELIVEVVDMIVGIVIDNLAELHSRIVVDLNWMS